VLPPLLAEQRVHTPTAFDAVPNPGRVEAAQHLDDVRSGQSF
jgi:hypothetical protein